MSIFFDSRDFDNHITPYRNLFYYCKRLIKNIAEQNEKKNQVFPTLIELILNSDNGDGRKSAKSSSESRGRE
ncbi:hypothetical protein BpHYR1_029637 [Brachionus plicatilis]|uniref:Uncharacterized protein n=1 Tax=Brachionus plicatilis TaxID=10195 RepID=A0A3M7RBY4_BRAPC|nr:hypothetical protein BpHYR1_029637 [Brachionus plicatilis]